MFQVEPNLPSYFLVGFPLPSFIQEAHRSWDVRPGRNISSSLGPELAPSTDESLKLGVAVFCLRTYSWSMLL